jgi:hypothetical protein
MGRTSSEQVMGFEIRPEGRSVVRIALLLAACNVLACLGAEFATRGDHARHARVAGTAAELHRSHLAQQHQRTGGTLLLGLSPAPQVAPSPGPAAR